MLRIYKVSLSIVRDVQPVVQIIARRDPNLADQLDRSTTSAPLNIAEGSYSRGRNRNKHYHIALGSTREGLSCLEVAHAKGIIAHLDESLVDRMRHVIGTLVNIVGVN
jgi:four helix bundle protein